ncbi:PF11074 domain protein [Leptospira inadai serovar Lyme str. 10]|uniref:PF11074 domain protein n=2 Tax=Leptospira inadai serovar Lyme TaxID=293084 RepID=V6H7V1_9LEPT|nr:DUF2779 domain-containing protein [Leptospira inadai]EQA34697.1 PF11074 domain protein [Leptospira inadai serovar Lyme str. 10]PNV75981.1 DUF2779 domain-containing protein [Leptospira inadai serovar Lyme]
MRTAARRFSFLFPDAIRRKLLFQVLAPYREEGLPRLGRSAYQAGLHCELKLWIQVKDPTAKSAEAQNQYISPKQKSILREIANRFYPEAIHARYNDRTTRAMLARNEAVRGAALQTDFFDFRADFLLPKLNGWEIVVVKASSSMKKSYSQELSFLRMVMEEAGFRVIQTTVLFLNSKYLYLEGEVDQNALFIRKDVSKETLAALPSTRDRAFRMLEVLEETSLPSRANIKSCEHPRSCQYPDNCLSDSPPGDLFSLREGKEETLRLWHAGIRNLSEIAEYDEFTLRQKIQINAVKSGREYLNKENLLQFMDKLRFPLYFLDFETINPPVPIYHKSNPFQHIPFLFSLHILRSNLKEEPEEFSYIDDNRIDPRLGILQSLSAKIGGGGTILAFNDTFEKRCLKESVLVFPEFRNWFESIESDFLDLALPFWDFDYYHPDQDGTTSLKSVLPVLTGENYKNLTINAGYLANSEFLRIKTETISEEERKRVQSDLKKYCRMDTYALILILRKLSEKLDWAPKL